MNLKNAMASIVTFAFLIAIIPNLGWSHGSRRTTGKQKALEYIQTGKSTGPSRSVASSQRQKNKKAQKSKVKKEKHNVKNQKFKKSKDHKTKIAKNKTKKRSKIKKQGH